MKPHLRFMRPKPLSHNHIDTITLSDGINGKRQRKAVNLPAIFAPASRPAYVVYLTNAGRVVLADAPSPAAAG